jgi:2-haloacid dehalogenase
MVHGEISGNVRVLEAIRAAGRPNYAITNFSREKFALARARFPFLARFDGTVVSAEERLLKPDPAIYRVLLDRYGLAAADCVFIDDSAANVAAARGLGMQAVHATPRLDLAAALAATGYELPSATVATGPTP